MGRKPRESRLPLLAPSSSPEMPSFLAVNRVDPVRTEGHSELMSEGPVCPDRGCVSVAGLFFILPCTDSFIKVDMRTISFDIPPQEVRLSSAVGG